MSAFPSKCSTCPYFVKRTNAPRPGITFDGECHLNPPSYVYELSSPHIEASSFSPVRSKDWCSMHPENHLNLENS